MGRPRWLLALLLTLGCGGGSDDDGAVDSGNMTCAPDELALEGSLDGEAVSHRSALTGYVWSQLGSGTLDTSFEKGGKFHAEWQQPVNDGQTFAATGSITLPATGPYGGETLAYTGGTFTKLDGGLRFKVTGFARTVPCVVAPCPSADVEGTLEGCVEPH